MNILAVADMESSWLWEHYERGRLDGIDLILSAGDLNSEYLSFLVTMANIPVLYVHGNHDHSYDRKPPEGCVCIDDKIYIHQGIRILGLGGSMKYNNGPYQYTEKEMQQRVWKLAFPLLIHKGFDILLTHAPARGVHDGEDLPHRGFEIFNTLTSRFHPAFHIHGHMHRSYDYQFRRADDFRGTKVINACEKYIFKYDK